MGTNITGIGNANAIGFKSRVTGGTYFPPELKDALVGVWSAYGKSNNSTDRNIIKNKIKDRGGDFVISNAAFKLNSGFGKYETELSNTRIWTQSKETTSSPFSSNYNGLSGWIVFANTELTNSADMPSFKIQVKGLLEGQELIYRYYDSNGQSNVYSMGKDGEYTLPADIRTAKPQTTNTSGFQVVKNDTNTITITQIPSFVGAFVTDGVDDLITSTKTVQEMGITDEITVVSMIHKISSDNNWTNLIGELKEDHTFVANRATNTDKTGIYGYTYNYVGDAIVINNILGDKNDYIVRTSTSLGLDNKYYVTGFRSAGIIQNISQIAWYWTFIANRVLTEDEINLVIEKYNLDRPGEIVKPQVYYNIKKQKISNDNHSAFDDKLIDYSGNGYDAKLYNFGWKEDSGIGKYETDFTDWKKSFKVTSFDSESIKFTSDVSWVLLYHPSSIGEDIPSFKVRIKLYGKGTLYYNYITQEGKYTNVAVKSEIFETPICYNTKYTGEKGVNVGFTLGVISGECSGTITQIPEYENALVLDGVDDYGKVTGLPILKDYTVVANRELFNAIGCVLSNDNPGAFIFETSSASAYSFGEPTTSLKIPTDKQIRYQTKYSYNGQNISIGAVKEGTSNMWLGTIRDNDARFRSAAIYSLMTFPYSMSEFLIERQLKKHKLGTLYPDMVEFRPVIKANANYKITYYQIDSTNTWKSIKVGDYIVIGAKLAFQITFDNDASELKEVVSPQLSGIIVEKRPSNPGYNIYSYITSKSPQKINITIDEYIRFEDIVQPYPVLLRFKDENGNEVSWGGKFKVGSTITRIGSAADSNLLPNIYNIFGLLLNGNQVTSSKVIVEKTMVFKAKSAYIFDNNEPKCILSPRLLRIPNSSYKILGYIPDISGHGNHGVIHNSAYAEGSGVNEDGSYQFDGVDDFVAIPTLSSGGKQVLMKVNLPRLNEIIYDQRKETNTYTFAILTTPSQIAYDQRNSERITYIDGILNTNIIAEQLMGVTHNIVVINSKANLDNTRSPILGRDINGNNWSRMRIYDFMLFDNISTDDKIKELNEYIGLSGNIFEFNPPTFTIDLPMAIKNIKVYQGGNEISPGYLYPNKDTEFEVYVSLNDGKYAVDTITVDGVEITKDRVVGEYNIFKFILNGSSEQKIKIHSYEYIMYEDINQPYPVIFKVKDRTTNQIYSWGDRIKIGSSIQLIHGENPNLLPELYSIISYTYEGNSYSYNQLTNLVITVTKTISVSCQKTWKLGSNEPKCILSPKRLKLANSSYKYLGYIPDISGNGNNGVFNNFAFSGMSGANGYTYEYINTSDFSVLSQYARTINSEKIEFFGYINAVTFYRKNPTYKGKIKIEGLTSAISSGKVQHFQIYTNSKTNTETSVFKTDGVYDIDVTGIGDATNVYFYVLPANTSESGTLDNPITIEQVGNYEGAICFDGIDDYVTIPTLSKGGKQVLMKVNWNTINSIIYDQRGSGGFAIYCSDYNNPSDPITVPAYKGRNAAGTTYIDGIRNEYIIASQLRNVTHNIVEILDTSYAAGNINPIIGKSYLNANYGKMSLYDFVLFDEVSTDEEIKQLNDIVGIEGGYVQKPPYYWDAYGKTNSDDDRSTIQQRGTAVGDYDITNYNHAYEGMSGYNGYPAVFGTNKTYANLVPNDGNFILTSSHNIINVTKFDTSYGLLYSHIKLDGKLTSRNIDYPSYKIKVTGLGENFGLHYSYLESSSDTTVKGFEINNDGIYIIPKSFASDGSLTSNSDWIGFIFTGTAPESCNVTIEVLPEYENGLVYDGVDDYSENTSIPAFTDYTYIIKYEDFNNPNTGSCIQRKGSIKAGGGAFVQDHIYRGTKYQYNFGISSNIHKDDSIAFCTKTNYNGTAIPSGNNTDDTGFTIGKFDGYRKMVFYKEMLYPRTVNMLTINMIKNMMAEDGIIDIQGKLFTDKFTGDFNLDFNKDFLIGN